MTLSAGRVYEWKCTCQCARRQELRSWPLSPLLTDGTFQSRPEKDQSDKCEGDSTCDDSRPLAPQQGAASPLGSSHQESQCSSSSPATGSSQQALLQSSQPAVSQQVVPAVSCFCTPLCLWGLSGTLGSLAMAEACCPQIPRKLYPRAKQLQNLSFCRLNCSSAYVCLLEFCVAASVLLLCSVETGRF